MQLFNISIIIFQSKRFVKRRPCAVSLSFLPFRSAMREKSAKILMVGPLPPPFSGGIASFIHGIRTCSALAEFKIHYLNTMVSKLVRKSVFRRVLFSLWLLTKLCACLTYNRPQLAHIHSSAFFSFYEKSVMLIICRLFGVRTILHLHSGHFHRFYSSTRIKFFVRFALNRTGTVIAVSPYWKTYFEKLCRKPVACVPNFATPKFFLPEQCGAPDGDILFVGKLSRKREFSTFSRQSRFYGSRGFRTGWCSLAPPLGMKSLNG